MSLSSVVLRSILPSLRLGKLFAHAGLLPSRKEEVNKVENLTWKHQEELFVYLTRGRSWEHLSDYFLDLQKKIQDPGLFFFVPVT